MSRSFKHNPYVKGNKRGRKFAKRQSNRKVRRYKKSLKDGNGYRKIYNPCNIFDFYYYYPLFSAKRMDEKHQRNNLSYVENWYQCCYRK